ncbi:MAG: phosphate ABC transporter permease subunit PstC [Nitrospirales bacterium]|nr:MAG: phosphate ABC transporter permease subunit PstC [Nitrospirales bacterium]
MTWSRTITSSPAKGDRILFHTLRCVAGIAGILLVCILIFLIIESLPALQHIGVTAFFTDASWHPTEGAYNLLPMFIGTLFATIGAVVLATPLGICSALFCEYYAPQAMTSGYRAFIELLAGIPSVVYGLWGLVVLVPLIASLHPPGPSLLAGILILTIMIFPTVTLVSLSALHQVPKEYIQGATALGCTRWSMIHQIILPSARPGILTGVVLQTGRALGETMAILMVCGNVVQYPSSMFDPIRTLTANIALEMAYATDIHRSSLFLTGLFLLTMVIVLIMGTQRARANQAYG